MIYLDQSYLTIQLDTDQDLSGASSLKINYTKPSGDTGSWTATASGQYIEYAVQPGDLDEVGQWRFQGEATISGRVAYTRTVKQQVKEHFT